MSTIIRTNVTIGDLVAARDGVPYSSDMPTEYVWVSAPNDWTHDFIGISEILSGEVKVVDAPFADSKEAERSTVYKNLMTNYPYTDAQYHALRLLASAHGHGWATSGVPSEHPIPGALWTQNLIQELYYALGRMKAWEPWQYGISAPDAPSSTRGIVYHTTGTGRLQWEVDDLGTVGIVICRPGETYYDDSGEHTRSRVVLSACVRGTSVEIRTPDTHDSRIPDVDTASWSGSDGPRAEVRHGDALLAALSTLVGSNIAEKAIDAAGVQRSPMMPVHGEGVLP